MTNFRHLTWMLIAAFGLVFSTMQSHAQKRPDADEPGLVADDGYELEPEWKKQVVYFRTTEAPGTIIVVTADHASPLPPKADVSKIPVPFFIKMRGQDRGSVVDFPIGTLLIHDLSLAMMCGQVKTPSEAIEWMKLHH